MTANASVIGAVLAKTETAWGENVATFSTPTRIAITQPIDITGLTHDKVMPDRVVQYRGESTEHIPGVMGGKFTLRGHLHGHGSATTGATSATDLGNLLAWALGTAATPPAGTTFTGGTATVPLTTASGTVPTGSLIRAGVLGDARGNGQFAATSTHSGTSLNLLTGLGAAPSNGDVMYSAETIHNDPSAHSVSESKRFFIATANQRFIAHGCFPSALRLGQTNPGQIPFWEIDVESSWFEPEASLTFPVTTTGDVFNPAPNAAGSCFVAAHGTATRATLDIRGFSIDIGMGISPVTGTGGVSAYQSVVGVRRTPDTVKVSLIVDAAASSATPTHWTNWLTGGKYHILYTLNSAPTQAVGIYLPCARYIGRRPSQMVHEGRNSVELEFECAANETVTTSGLTLSQIRIGLS